MVDLAFCQGATIKLLPGIALTATEFIKALPVVDGYVHLANHLIGDGLDIEDDEEYQELQTELEEAKEELAELEENE